MHRPGTIIGIAALVCLELALAGCGDSVPLPPGVSNDAGGPLMVPYAPSTGAFTVLTTASSQPVAAITTCSLDAVNGQPVGGAPVPHASTATFTGWATDSGSGKVPAEVQLVLHGTRDYAVKAATGMRRPDVAKANGHGAWTSAGYSVKADLSGVASGTYTPVLRFEVDGKHLQCFPSTYAVVVR